jgi:hypothetical protein
MAGALSLLRTFVVAARALFVRDKKAKKLEKPGDSKRKLKPTQNAAWNSCCWPARGLGFPSGF